MIYPRTPVNPSHPLPPTLTYFVIDEVVQSYDRSDKRCYVENELLVVGLDIDGLHEGLQRYVRE